MILRYVIYKVHLPSPTIKKKHLNMIKNKVKKSIYITYDKKEKLHTSLLCPTRVRKQC